MFTGIIEEVGIVSKFGRLSHGADLRISCSKVLEDVKLGDSISVNGVCQTVVDFDNTSFGVKVSDETLNVSNLSHLKTGNAVNLERALKLSDRLSGHIVSGHVETVVKYIQKEQLGEFYNMYFEIPQNYLKYMVKKGSVTINGISLTIADIKENNFSCAVIPHTFENTNLKELKNGDIVNIETDILAKYAENFIVSNEKREITKSFLEENGFL
ncbi:riboflavin synthase [bacterium]|nr:riboflavin synthase [bacterium]